MVNTQMVKTELENFLDQKIADIINESKERFHQIDPVEFSGLVSGFLLATATKLACKVGALARIKKNIPKSEVKRTGRKYLWR